MTGLSHRWKERAAGDKQIEWNFSEKTFSIKIKEGKKYIFFIIVHRIFLRKKHQDSAHRQQHLCF